MDLPLTEQSEDDSQWQSINDIVGQLPVDQTGLSFSDAETQFPVKGVSSVLKGESFSDAETRDQMIYRMCLFKIPFEWGK